MVDNGFLDNFDLRGKLGVTQDHSMIQAVEELQRRLGHIEKEIDELKRRQPAGDLLFVVVCVNVTVVVVAMLKK